MPIEKPNKLVDLSVAFAVEILNLVKYLKEQRETIISNQIGRAGPYEEKCSNRKIPNLSISVFV